MDGWGVGRLEAFMAVLATVAGGPHLLGSPNHSGLKGDSGALEGRLRVRVAKGFNIDY